MQEYEKQLKKQQAIGMSYGSKAFAQVVKDKFKPYIKETFNPKEMTDEEKNDLLNDIYKFISTTLETSIEGLQKALQNLSNNKTNKERGN